MKYSKTITFWKGYLILWLAFGASMITLMASCSKEEKCYECNTVERIEHDDGSTTNSGYINEGEIVCEEKPERSSTERISGGIKHTTRRCK